MKRRFSGGVHPVGYKELSQNSTIVDVAPREVAVALRQHIGVACAPCVKVGERVLAGQLIGDAEGLCVPVHASLSGTVCAIEPRPCVKASRRRCWTASAAPVSWAWAAPLSPAA